ncbi:DUF3331 domain-containing protein [Paraburkholderia sp. GAS199]|uniref:DUF3331 domain-containing protein n=1 Tax=Paraburkholderia sp. GAS199 TaxID=3035126 RepID=UPI003D1E0F33
MANLHANTDPWIHIMRVLRCGRDVTNRAEFLGKTKKTPCPVLGSPSNTKVSVTGRSTDRTLTVMWCNPTIGYYGAQTWCMSFAQEAGICQMSGEQIYRGDCVFRPRCGSTPPVNANAMILAKHVHLPAIDEAPVKRLSGTRPHGRLQRKQSQSRLARK